MTTHDTQGREYAKITELQEGSLVQVDAGFDCIRHHSIHAIAYDEDEGFHYIECDHGRFALGGQIADDGIHLIGVYKVRS